MATAAEAPARAPSGSRVRDALASRRDEEDHVASPGAQPRPSARQSYEEVWMLPSTVNLWTTGWGRNSRHSQGYGKTATLITSIEIPVHVGSEVSPDISAT